VTALPLSFSADASCLLAANADARDGMVGAQQTAALQADDLSGSARATFAVPGIIIIFIILITRFSKP
jgi:hypothetical protein